MVRDAQSHANEDQTRRALIDARNQADSLAYQVEKTVNENRDRLAAEDVSRIEGLIAQARQAAQGEDVGAITRAVEELQRGSHAMAEQLYRHTGGSSGSGSSGSPGSHGPDVKEGEVVDAEYAETR
jgi:molecular chaperone DnaK